MEAMKHTVTYKDDRGEYHQFVAIADHPYCVLAELARIWEKRTMPGQEYERRSIMEYHVESESLRRPTVLVLNDVHNVEFEPVGVQIFLPWRG